MTPEELSKLESKELSQFKTGKPLFGKGGSFASLLQNFLEKTTKSRGGSLFG